MEQGNILSDEFSQESRMFEISRFQYSVSKVYVDLSPQGIDSVKKYFWQECNKVYWLSILKGDKLINNKILPFETIIFNVEEFIYSLKSGDEPNPNIFDPHKAYLKRMNLKEFRDTQGNIKIHTL